MRIVVVVQARTGSTRLPGKVLRPLAGQPLLLRLLERIRASRTPFELVVATTWLLEDDPLAELCDAARIRCFRGHPKDLLDRHYRAALFASADVVVKIPSDCPLIDPAVVDRVIECFLADPAGYDFVSNLHPASWPDGNDVEVMTVEALAKAWREARAPWEREHTTPFLWDHPERFRIGNVRWESCLNYSMTHRFTVDYPEDLAFATAVFEALERPDRPVFGLAEILAFLEARPEILALNARFAGVNWYRNHLGALRTVGLSESRFAPGERFGSPEAP